jgi:hypothetical protein
MASSASPSPDFPLKKESISFAPPPAALSLPRLSQDTTHSTDDELTLSLREHPELSHRRSSSVDRSGSSRKGRVMSSPPPPPAYTPRGTGSPFRMEVNSIVSFDTFDTQDATTFALTLRSKHRYCLLRRLIIVCIDIITVHAHSFSDSIIRTIHSMR